MLIRSTELRLLVRTLYSLRVIGPVLRVELNCNWVVRSTAIQATALNAGHVGHDLELSVEGGATVAAEPMLVDLAGIAFGIVVLWLALCDLEVRAWDYDI